MNSEKTIQIFEANPDRGAPVRKLATDLALQFGITAKAVRDIWNLRTWVQTTKPYWTQEDHDHFNLNKRQSLNHACARRARPAMCARGLAPVRSVQARPVGVAPQSNARFCLMRRPKLRRAAWIGEPSFFPMLDVYEESPCEETPATMFSCQDDASARGDNDVVWWMESVDEQEGPFSGPEAEIRSRQGRAEIRSRHGWSRQAIKTGCLAASNPPALISAFQRDTRLGGSRAAASSVGLLYLPHFHPRPHD